jgi:hypothetical protein
MVAGKNRSTRRKTNPSATLCTGNLARTGLGSNKDFRGQISHGSQINIKFQPEPRCKHTQSGLQISLSVFVGRT